MANPDSVDALRAGPRGRRLCMALVEDPAAPTMLPFPYLVHMHRQAPARALADPLRSAVAATDVGAIAETVDPRAFLDALLTSVTTAMYWQPPDEHDRALTDPRLAELLRPIAEAVLEAPAAAWWSRPVNLSDQRHVL